MADIPRNVGKVFRLSATVAGEGTNKCILGDASDGIVGTIALHLVSNGFTGTVTVQARARNPEAAQPVTPPMPAAPVAFLPIPYLKLNMAGAAVSPPAYYSAAITGNCIILIPATGLSIALDCVVSAGEAWIYWTPTEGAAA